MNARRARPRYVDAELTISSGHVIEGPQGPELEFSPRASYRCLRCPYQACVSGRRTAAWAADIRTAHRAVCPGLKGTRPSPPNSKSPG